MGNREVAVNMNELKEWADRHQPNPKEQLVAVSWISARTIHELFKGIAPRLPRTRVQLARAMRKPIENLFQPAKKAG